MNRTDSNDGLRFVIVNQDQFTRAGLKRHLNSAGFRVLGEGKDLKAGLRLIRGLQPDFVLLGVGKDVDATLDTVRTVREELPHTGIILLSNENAPELILSSVRAGAHEFLTLPLDYDELDQAIGRLRTMMVQLSATPARRGRILAVCPTKGGVGGSSIASNLALSLAMQPSKRVALVDFGLPGGDAAFMLDIEPKHHIASALRKNEIDEELLRTQMASHRSGLRLLTVYELPTQSNLLKAEHVPQLFGVLGSMFDYIVVDVGSYFGARVSEMLDLADELLVVSSLDGPTLRNTSRYFDLLDRLEIPRDRVRLLVNRHQDDSISNQDLEEAVRTEVFWSLPNDYRPMRHALDAREPVVVDSPGTRLAGSYRGLAATLGEIHAEIDMLGSVQERSRRAGPST